MKFAHISDCHIGGWKEEKMRALNLQCFQRAVELVIERHADFLLISGDLFNSAVPQIEYIKEATVALKTLRDVGIRVYVIAGSHDYSPSGKMMLDVLEKAGLVTNVMKFRGDGTLAFTIDQSGAKITGMIGKKGGLEINEYETLNTRPLEEEDGFKIFMFHTAINEFKPEGLEEMPGVPVAQLPANFHYYAGGHVHYVFQKPFGNGVLTYPGALFPNNFKEMEEWQNGGIYFVDENVAWEYVPIRLKDVVSFTIDVTGLTPELAMQKIINEVKRKDIIDKIVTLRVFGELHGNVSDLNFLAVADHLKTSYFVLRNTAKLQSKEFEGMTMKQGTVEEIEHQLLTEGAKGETAFPGEKEATMVRMLMHVLDKEREDGERVADFEHRVVSDTLQVLEIEAS